MSKGLSLFPRQLRFVRDQTRYPAAIGGIGSGKTFVGSAKALSRIGRREVGLVCAPTYKILVDATQRTYLNMLESLGVEYRLHKSEHRLTIPRSGHEILFRSLDNPDNLRGPNVAWAWVDEAAYVTGEAWRIVKGRVRVGDYQQAWITGTPKGRNWIYDEWVVEESQYHSFYRFRTDENITLAPEYISSLGYSGRFAEQELAGEFISFEGLVYSNFDRSVHVKQVDTHNWWKVQAVDIGARNPTTVLTIAVSPNRHVHVEREFYQRNMSASAIIEALQDEYDMTEPDAMYIDPSGLAYIAALVEAGYSVQKADNRVVQGIQTVASVLDNGFTIDPSCVHTISEFEQYQYPESDKKADHPLKQNDHCMDALRYGTMGVIVGGRATSIGEINAGARAA